MPDIINANYQVVQERTPEVICTEIKTIDAQVCAFAIEGAIKIGQRLTELKAMVGHGNWLEWCEQNLGYKEKQVQRFIKISTTYGDENSPFSNSSILSDLSISKAYSLLAVPEDEVETFVEQHDIGAMKVSELEAEIKEWKSKAEAADASLTEEKSRNEELQKAIEEGESRRLALAKEISVLEEQSADPEEVEKLKKQLEKAQMKVQKAEAALATEKANLQDKIDAAVNSKSDELKKAAEIEQQRNIRQLEVNLKYANEETERLRKQLEQSYSDEVTTFKVLSKQLQQNFHEMKQAMQSMSNKDFAQAERMKGALKKVLANLIDDLEG